MTITLSSFLFIYIVYIFVFLFFSFFNLYHMIRFGLVSVFSYIITFGYIFLSILIVAISYYYIAQIDWTMPFDLFNVQGQAIMFDVDF